MGVPRPFLVWPSLVEWGADLRVGSRGFGHFIMFYALLGTRR